MRWLQRAMRGALELVGRMRPRRWMLRRHRAAAAEPEVGNQGAIGPPAECDAPARDEAHSAGDRCEGCDELPLEQRMHELEERLRRLEDELDKTQRPADEPGAALSKSMGTNGDVLRGQPQAIAGQQARRTAAHLWEGVL